MLLVILGAGASHDISPGAQAGTEPPLTAEMFRVFEDLLPAYVGAAAVVARVEHGLKTHGETVESQLQKLRDTALSGYDPLKGDLIAIQYVLQEGFAGISERWARRRAGINNLAVLVGALEEWRSAANQKLLYLTFNYDTLLESALFLELRQRFDEIDNYLGDERSVLKVHGSCNWKREVDGATGHLGFQGLIDRAAYLTLTDRFVVANDPRMSETDNRFFVPAVSIPVLNKAGPDEFSCPETHLQRMREWLPAVTQILVIGWHGAEAHFLEELRQRVNPGVAVTVVGAPPDQYDLPPSGETPEEDCSALPWIATAGITGPCVRLRSGFSRFVDHYLDQYVADLPR